MHGDASDFLLPGFVDAHVHFPQTYTTSAHGGGQLLEWLDSCVFPSEARLEDEGFARMIARDFTRRRIMAGTTSALVFGSAFPHAQDALFEASRDAGLRLVSGRGIQTVGPGPATLLLTSEEDAIALSCAEIDRWHAVDTGDATTATLQVAIVPRFSSLGHADDAPRPRRAVRRGAWRGRALPLAPQRERPARHGRDRRRPRGLRHRHLPRHLRRPVPARVGARRIQPPRPPQRLRPRGALPGFRRLARLAETGSSIAHCPTSQQFLGSGTMPWRRTIASGVNVAIGSDVGAGDEWLVSRVLNDAFKVHLSEPGDAGVEIDAAELFFTGTLAGARALDMEERHGNLDVGKDADFLRVTPDLWELLARTLEHGIRADDDARATDQILFTLLMGLREPAIAGVFVQGRRVSAG
ncbi:amidohydrolase family protein [Clavibacter tessellarius]|uniref:amidohydrolase family protein n=1 Tax=Clavibacter tessellarius TaxID=31965 RepID=UPI00324DCBB8